MFLLGEKRPGSIYMLCNNILRYVFVTFRVQPLNPPFHHVSLLSKSVTGKLSCRTKYKTSRKKTPDLTLVVILIFSSWDDAEALMGGTVNGDSHLGWICSACFSSDSYLCRAKLPKMCPWEASYLLNVSMSASSLCAC